LQGATGTADTYRPLLVPATSFINSFPKGDRRRTWGILDQYPNPKVKGGVLAPFFQKYFDTTGISKGATSSTVINPWNFIYIRYADMYLVAAEAENEINGPNGAYMYINAVRKRARVDKSDPTNVPDLSGLTQDDFRKAVLKERKWEFALEGNTWFDMKRTNTFQLIQAERGSQLINPIGPYNQTWLIPDIEITANNIPQNPLY
uniref:RagB/SusD family nutrient uptake outer membrane protein n=1 Tax=Pedobacter sp. ASV12 TaxID=2795120 RepID=UPI0018EC8F45